MRRNIKNLLLENIGIRQTILKNTFWLGAAEVITGFLRLILIIYVARILGANEYGKFSFAFSFVSMMVIFSDLGIIDITTRELSRHKEKEREFPAILALEIILDAIVLIFMIVGSFFITSDLAIQKIIWVLSPFILITSSYQVFYSFLRSRQKMEYEAIIKIAQAVIMVGLAFLVIFYIPSALNLSYGYLFSNLLILPFLLLFFHFYFQPIKLIWDKNIFRLLKISWPLTLGFMGGWIYMTISSVMLGYFNLITENGWYNAASKIAYIAVIPAGLIIRSFYPMLSNFFISSKEKLQKSWDYLMGSMVFLAMPIIVGGIVLAPKIINFLYGEGFGPSVFALQLLVIAIGIGLINCPYSVMLVVGDQQKKNFVLIIAGVVINILLNFILISKFGLYGAAMATTITSLIILLSTIIISKYFIPLPIFNKKILKNAFIAGFSTLLMFFVISYPLIYNLNVLFSIIIGALTYFFLLLCFISFSKNNKPKWK